MYQKSLGGKILRMSRDNLTEQEEKCGYDATFKEFMMYFANNTRHLMADQHWNPFCRKCNPCVIQYDKVIKLETGHSDELVFMHDDLKAVNKTDIYLRNNQSSLNEDGLAKRNYKQIYKEFADVRRVDFDMIKNLYSKELDLFGFSSELKEDGMHAACKTETLGGDMCC